MSRTPFGERALVEHAADRVGQLGDVAHRGGEGARRAARRAAAGPAGPRTARSRGRARDPRAFAATISAAACSIASAIASSASRLSASVSRPMLARGLLREQHALAGGRGGRGHPPSVSTAVRMGPVAGGARPARGSGGTTCRSRRPRAPAPTRSALVTSTPIPDAAASRAADTLVAAPPVPTLLTTTEPNSKPCRSSPYATLVDRARAGLVRRPRVERTRCR